MHVEDNILLYIPRYGRTNRELYKHFKDQLNLDHIACMVGEEMGERMLIETS